jgi:transcriptional regulator with XRE-family HTH domain
MSLRDVERRTGIQNGHLSQLETGTITKPDLALLWELAVLYDLDFGELLELSGHAGSPSTRGEQRQRLTVALRALGDLTPEEQADTFRFIADLKRRRGERPR